MEIKAYGELTCNCKRCGTRAAVAYYYWATKSEQQEIIKKTLREKYGWKITRDGRIYCKDCAKEIGLRGTKKEG